MQIIDKQQSGYEAELEACKFLQAKGLTLVESNYRCYFGEIDLIMRDHDYLVFIEVRKRNNLEYGNASQSITRAKVKKIIKTASHYLQVKKILYKVACRFDIIAIHPIGGKMQLEWFRNAFTTDK